MQNKLIKRFQTYAEQTKAFFNSQKEIQDDQNSNVLHLNENYLINNIVEQLENSHDFELFSNEISKQFNTNEISRKFYGKDSGLKNYLRRSGFYLNLYKDKELNFQKIYETYSQILTRNEDNITFLLPLEDIAFGKDAINFSNFKIIRFTEMELKELLQSEINQIFYPKSFIDVKYLKMFWFLCFTRKLKRKIWFKPQELSISKLFPDLIIRKDIVDSVDEVILGLTFINWKDYCVIDYDTTIHPPFTINLNTDLSSYPDHAPDISRLDNDIIEYDDKTGKEYYVCGIMLNENETTRFEKEMNKIFSKLSLIHNEKNKWPFINIAVSYFFEAYFTKFPANLLWYITTLEALVHEKGKSINQTLPKRIGSILGNNESEKKDIAKKIKNLYNLRCDLVHGSQSIENISGPNVSTARSIARKALIWFVNYFADIQQRINAGKLSESPLSRSSFLAMIDIEENDRRSIAGLINQLPVSSVTKKKK